MVDAGQKTLNWVRAVKGLRGEKRGRARTRISVCQGSREKLESRKGNLDHDTPGTQQKKKRKFKGGGGGGSGPQGQMLGVQFITHLFSAT